MLPTVGGRSEERYDILGSIRYPFYPPGFNWCFSFAPELVSYLAPRDLHRRAANSICETSFLIHHGIYHDLFVCQ